MNVSSTALKYAEALADVAQEQADADAAGTDLAAMAALLAGDSELKQTLDNPAVPASAKRNIINQIASLQPFSDYARNFVLVLLENGRMGLFDEVVEAYRLVLDERAGIVAVDVVSARPLSEQHRGRLEEVLKEVTASEVRCHFEVDETLLGGMKLQIGSKVFDGSVRTRLDEIRAAISGAR